MEFLDLEFWNLIPFEFVRWDGRKETRGRKKFSLSFCFDTDLKVSAQLVRLEVQYIHC